MVESKVGRYVAARSDRGPRRSNQDCAFAGTLTNASGIEVWVVCVADGVGGGQHGEQAATLAVNSLRALIKESAFSDVTALKALVPQWIEGLNEAVKDIAGEGLYTNNWRVTIWLHSWSYWSRWSNSRCLPHIHEN